MRLRGLRLVAIPAAVAAILAGSAGPAAAAPVRPAAVSGWTQLDRSLASSLTSNEGIATVQSGTGTTLLTRGIASIPIQVLLEGWTHIGDPDSTGGYVFDAYQGPDGGSTKMFRVTTPTGQSYEYVHALVAGELFNNSFATISPDGQWLIAGEWNTMNHLQVYPAPLLNPATPRTGGSLALAGLITLDHPVNDVQGCDFVTATRLLCASDDSGRTLFPDTKPLLQVDLTAPVRGAASGHVTDLGSIPQQSICSGTYEAEGVDYDTTSGQLRLEMIEPSVCAVVTDIYRYRSAAA
jgi:hypothetical protein